MPVARRESEDSYLCVVIFKVFTENCLKSGGREESMNKKVSKLIFLPSSSFSSGLRVFTARHHLAMAGADKTIIRAGKNNAQANNMETDFTPKRSAKNNCFHERKIIKRQRSEFLPDWGHEHPMTIGHWSDPGGGLRHAMVWWGSYKGHDPGYQLTPHIRCMVSGQRLEMKLDRGSIGSNPKY